MLVGTLQSAWLLDDGDVHVTWMERVSDSFRFRQRSTRKEKVGLDAVLGDVSSSQFPLQSEEC